MLGQLGQREDGVVGGGDLREGARSELKKKLQYSRGLVLLLQTPHATSCRWLLPAGAHHVVGFGRGKDGRGKPLHLGILVLHSGQDRGA